MSKIVLDTKRLVELRLRRFKLDSVSRFTQLLSALVVALVVVLFLFLGLVVGSIAVFMWLSTELGAGWAFLIVTGFYLLAAVIVLLLRRPLIMVPLSSIIGSILLDEHEASEENFPEHTLY